MKKAKKITENEKKTSEALPVAPEAATPAENEATGNAGTGNAQAPENRPDTPEPTTEKPAPEPEPEAPEEPAETEAEAPEKPAETEKAPTPEEIARMIAEAEQRGYLRGRNEQIERLMEAPTGYEAEGAGEISRISGEPMILGSIRPSIWDL